MTLLLARADARALPLCDGCVQCVVTSVPYFRLRKYECGAADHLQVGLEQTPEEFVENLLTIFREVRRVLRSDGVCWVNVGDGYAGAGRGKQGATSLKGGRKNQEQSRDALAACGNVRVPDGYKPGDLYGVPWKFAEWMRRDGWYLRSEVIWAKGRSFDETPGSCQPESATDRPARSHEQVFLFTKSCDYFYDLEAAKEPASKNSHPRGKSGVNPRCAEPGSGIKQNSSFSAAVRDLVESRNLRSVWAINTRPNPVGGHYAAFPDELVEPMVLVGTSAKGACASCGAPWERILEKSRTLDGEPVAWLPAIRNTDIEHPERSKGIGHRRLSTVTRTTGWRPTCTCATDTPPRPCIVLDPFAGTGTVGAVALRHGRYAVCCDLSASYLHDLATRRTSHVQIDLLSATGAR